MRKQDEDRNGKPEALLWLDFETTGTDRNDSLPLEVGMECTDVLGEHSFGSLHRIIRPDYLDLLGMSPIAFSMHTDNGLLFELLNGSAHDDCVGAVANAVEEYLDSLSQRFTLVPAGTNVDFDIDFLKRLDLAPDRWLSYRKFDLTTLRRYLRFIDCPEDPYEGHRGSHRVRDCIRRDINDYIRYRTLLKKGMVTMKKKTTKTVSKETRPRKWHKPVPCPTCGSRNISFDRIAWAVNRKTFAIRQIWACACQHHHGILILTRHDDLKEAIRAWNTEATRQERKHSK